MSFSRATRTTLTSICHSCGERSDWVALENVLCRLSVFVAKEVFSRKRRLASSLLSFVKVSMIMRLGGSDEQNDEQI